MYPDLTSEYDFAFEHAMVGMAILSEAGTLLKINQALCDLLGCKAPVNCSDEVFTEISQLMPHMSERYKDNFLNIVNCAQHMILQQKEQDYMEQSYTHLSGEQLWIKVNISIIPVTIQHDSSYLPPYQLFVQFMNETTDRTTRQLFHSAVDRLIERDDILHLFLRGLPMSVIIINNGFVQYVNAIGLQLVGAASQEQLIGTRTVDLFEPIDSAVTDNHNNSGKSHTSSSSLPSRIRCLNGESKLVEGFSLSINYQGEPVTVMFYKDVTNKKREEEQLIQSEKLSIAGQLAAGIAHEIRNPLTSINGFLKLIRNTKRNEDRFFDIIESELKRIEFIVNELLILSKPTVTDKFRATELISILDQVTTLMKIQAAMSNIEIEYDHKHPEIWVHADANLLKQVFINLLKNAIEAMSSGGTIAVLLHTTLDEVRIQVIDEGIGIPPEKLQLLGQPFFTTKTTGTGLGLMICFNILHNHNGELLVESSSDVGTTFTVQLPLLRQYPSILQLEHLT